MSAATVMMLVGLVGALVGVGVAVRAGLQGRPVTAGVADDTPVEDVADALARVSDTFRSTDRALRIGVVVAAGGLLLAGIGAYLGSDARALGADVGGSGSSDNARVGGTW